MIWFDVEDEEGVSCIVYSKYLLCDILKKFFTVFYIENFIANTSFKNQII